MVRICRFLLIVLTVAYFLALALLAIGTFGLFGAEKDPLAAVFLVPIGPAGDRMRYEAVFN